MSFLEVYNEALACSATERAIVVSAKVLRDLLGSEGSNLVHVIKHDDAWGTVVTNLTLMEAGQVSRLSFLVDTYAHSGRSLTWSRSAS